MDQGEGGHRVQMTPSQGIPAGAPHVGQPLLEPDDPEADQHNRLRNLPASATSVTCKRICSPHRNTWAWSLTFFYNFFYFLWVHDFCVSAADSTLDSGMGSTVYSDSHSSQQSVLYQSLLEPITMATQQVCIGSIHTQVDHVHSDLLKYTHCLNAAIAHGLWTNRMQALCADLHSLHTFLDTCRSVFMNTVMHITHIISFHVLMCHRKQVCSFSSHYSLFLFMILSFWIT